MCVCVYRILHIRIYMLIVALYHHDPASMTETGSLLYDMEILPSRCEQSYCWGQGNKQVDKKHRSMSNKLGRK